jgi:hypothetical protein
MPLKPGDRVTLSCNPTIKLGDYMSAKPFASVSRELSYDVTGDMQQLQDDLRSALFKALRVELEATNEIYEALGADPDMDNLLNYCRKVTQHEKQSLKVEGDGKETGKRRTVKPAGG